MPRRNLISMGTRTATSLPAPSLAGLNFHDLTASVAFSSSPSPRPRRRRMSVAFPSGVTIASRRTEPSSLSSLPSSCNQDSGNKRMQGIQPHSRQRVEDSLWCSHPVSILEEGPGTLTVPVVKRTEERAQIVSRNKLSYQQLYQRYGEFARQNLSPK